MTQGQEADAYESQSLLNIAVNWDAVEKKNVQKYGSGHEGQPILLPSFAIIWWQNQAARQAYPKTWFICSIVV